MNRVVKGNKELQVDDEYLSDYLAQGYSIVDKRGNIVKTARSKTYDELVEENIALNKQVQKLNAAVDAYQKPSKQSSGENKSKNNARDKASKNTKDKTISTAKNAPQDNTSTN